MKKFKVIVIILLIIFLVFGGAYLYLFYLSSKPSTAFKLVPQSALFVLETNKIAKTWENITESPISKSLIHDQELNELGAQIETINTFLDVPFVEDFINKRSILISGHASKEGEIDLLLFMDVEAGSSYLFSTDIIKSRLTSRDFEVSEMTYNGYEIHFIQSTINDTKFYLCFVDDVLVGAQTEYLIKEVIDNKEVAYFGTELLTELKFDIKNKSDLTLYLNYTVLKEYLQRVASNENQYLLDLANTLNLSVFDLNMLSDRIALDGTSTKRDSLEANFISALLNTEPSTNKSDKIISANCALYVSFAFRDFKALKSNLLSIDNESLNGNDIQSSLDKIEHYLKVDFKKYVFDWIGEEITLVKLHPSETTEAKDLLICIHSHDIKKSKEGLEVILEAVRKKTPLKFKSFTYHNYEINYLHAKGFFKAIFGNLLKGIEIPFYTIIDDFVVFSNSSEQLKIFIDDYTKEHTLIHNQDYNTYKRDIEEYYHSSVYINTPKFYSHLYHFGKADMRSKMKKNKNSILCFNKVFFQLSPSKNNLASSLQIMYNPNAVIEEQIEFIRWNDETNLQKLKSLDFKVTLNSDESYEDGEVIQLYDDGITKAKGSVRNGLLEGLWRIYYPSGNIKASLKYKDNYLNEQSLFYYDDKTHKIKEECFFNNNKLEGIYSEYLKNGAQKMKIQFKEGEQDGDAFYYYDNGRIRAEGTYADDKKHGKWKYFDPNGKIIGKEKWAKGMLKE